MVAYRKDYDVTVITSGMIAKSYDGQFDLRYDLSEARYIVTSKNKTRSQHKSNPSVSAGWLLICGSGSA